VRRGVSVGLAHPLLEIEADPMLPFIPEFPSLAPQPTVPLDPDNGNPFFHWMNPPSFTSDRYNISYHGSAHSHLDALCHFQFDYGDPGRPDFRLFNGLSRPANNTAEGCDQLSIENLIDGVVTRGVLFDATLIPELREAGYPWLAPGTAVTREHLETLERLQRVRVEPGDVILLYTGRWARRAALGPWSTNDGVAGYYVDTVPFMYQRRVSFIGHDMWNDVTPGGFPGFATLPVHTFAINVLGVDIFDNLDLEKLAGMARLLNRYEFLFTAAPSPVKGGTGSPLNPLATF
jgi:kynurenine formamidase